MADDDDDMEEDDDLPYDAPSLNDDEPRECGVASAPADDADISGTDWSAESELGEDLRDAPPRSRALPTTQGWRRTSSVVIRSPGSFRSRHLMRHLARDESESGRENWPRRILANNPLCSAPWKGYLEKKTNVNFQQKKN